MTGLLWSSKRFILLILDFKEYGKIKPEETIGEYYSIGDEADQNDMVLFQPTLTLKIGEKDSIELYGKLIYEIYTKVRQSEDFRGTKIKVKYLKRTKIILEYEILSI